MQHTEVKKLIRDIEILRDSIKHDSQDIINFRLQA